MDPFNVLTVIYALVHEIRGSINKAQRTRRRLGHLFERIEWFADKFAAIERNQSLRPEDVKILEDFRDLLNDIYVFTQELQTDSWLGRLWRSTANEDAIDDFNARLEDARNDLIFIFTVDTPLPRAWGKGDEQDIVEIIDHIRYGEANTLERELAMAKVEKKALIEFLERKLRESCARSENLDWRDNLVQSFGSTLKANDFRPSLYRLSKDRFPSLVVGEGSFGVVYRCQWRGEIVAVKVLKMQMLSQKALAQLTEEMRIMLALGSSKNVIAVYGLLPEPLSLVMSYAAQGNLRQNLDQLQAPMTASQLHHLRWRWAYEIANGMAWLHSASPPIIHRDLKCDNILVDEDGRLLVSDFGCAVAKSETLTMTGETSPVAVGSVPYMPPEAFETGRQGAEGDVYAYGIVLWEILTRETPWGGLHPALVPTLVQSGQRPVLPQPDSPSASEFTRLITECWAPKAGKRPPFVHIKAQAHIMTQKTPRAPRTPFTCSLTPESTSLPNNDGASLRVDTKCQAPVVTLTPSAPTRSRLQHKMSSALSQGSSRLRLEDIKLRTSESGSSLDSSVISSPPAILPYAPLTPGGSLLKSSTPLASGPTLVSKPSSTRVEPRPVQCLNHGGIKGLCEWLIKAGADDAPEITIRPVPTGLSRSLLRDVLAIGDEKPEDLLKRLNQPCRDKLHTVADAVKEYCKQLKEPLTTLALYDPVLALGIGRADNDEGLSRDLARLFTRIPEPSFSILRAVFEFLGIVKAVPQDRLSFEWAPVLFRSEAEVAASESVLHSKVFMRVCRVTISHYKIVFPASLPEIGLRKRLGSIRSSSRKGSLFSSGSQKVSLQSARSSSNSTLPSQGSSHFRPKLSVSFSAGLQSFVKAPSDRQLNVPLASAVSSSSLLSGDIIPLGDIVEETGFVGVDPVSKVRLTEDSVYARNDGICFQNAATQNFFYKMLDSDHEFLNGIFIESTNTERVWAIRSSKGDYAVLGGSSKNQKLTFRIRLTGERKHYVHFEVAEHKKDPLAYFIRSQNVSLTMQLLTSEEQPHGATMTFTLSPTGQPSFKHCLHIPHGNFILEARFETAQRSRRYIIKGAIERPVLPKHRKDLIHIRRQTLPLIRENERIVEFEKDAFGLGISVGWCAVRNAVTINAVEPGGAAARSGLVSKGDFIRAVQGCRVDTLDHKTVGRLLRQIPLVAVLVVESAPALRQEEQRGVADKGNLARTSFSDKGHRHKAVEQKGRFINQADMVDVPQQLISGNS